MFLQMPILNCTLSSIHNDPKLWNQFKNEEIRRIQDANFKFQSDFYTQSGQWFYNNLK